MAKDSYSNPKPLEEIQSAAEQCSEEQGGATVEGKSADPIKETGTSGYDGWDNVGKGD